VQEGHYQVGAEWLLQGVLGMITYGLRRYPLWFRPVVIAERITRWGILTAVIDWWQSHHSMNDKVPSVGEVLDNEYLIPMNLAEEDLADKLGISDEAVYDLLDKDNVITEEIADKLDQVLKTEPGYWMRLQRKRAEYLLAKYREAR
jgi:addiction module HigA family antidote